MLFGRACFLFVKTIWETTTTTFILIWREMKMKKRKLEKKKCIRQSNVSIQCYKKTTTTLKISSFKINNQDAISE